MSCFVLRVLSLCLFAVLSFQVAAASTSSCELLLKPATRLEVIDGRTRSVKDKSRFIVEDLDNDFFFQAFLDERGTLNFSAALSDSQMGVRSRLKGSELYAQMMRHFGTARIQRVIGQWVDGDNYESFFELIDRGMSSEQAALQTWSGRKAVEYGFSSVDSVSVRASTMTGRLTVVVEFVRP